VTVIPETKERVLGLIDFLAAYDARKNPPIHDIATYGLYLLRDVDLPRAPGVHLSPLSDAWLTVDFVELPPCPACPAPLARMLAGLESADLEHRPEVVLPDELTERDFADAEAAERWLAEEWDPWAESYGQARATKRLYRDLFEQRERLAVDRDAVELVWGFGRLRWLPDERVAVDHPVLTIPAEIDVDETSNELRVRAAGAVEVESLYLADLSLDDRPGFNAFRQSLADSDDLMDPWDQVGLSELSRRIVRSIDHDGTLIGEADSPANSAVVDRSWVLYLRRRRPDYQGFLDKLRDLYKSGAAVPPDPLQALVVDAPSLLVHDDEREGEANDRAREPLLLPLATNEEQQRILTLAQRRPGVTVQGPPGTGKSHTIANIISHYVAYGHRVLVVAEKEQALRVLAEKVPPGIRDLTVSVLGADEDGRRRLESAISQIQTRVSAIDKDDADEAIARLTKELDRVDRTIAETTNRLLAASAAEAGSINGQWLVGAHPTPTEAAQWVASHAERLGYIDDPLDASISTPLSAADLAEFVALINEVGVQRAEACAFELPPLTALPPAANLANHFARLNELRAELGRAAPDLSSWEHVDAASTSAMEDLADAVANEHAWAAKIAGTWLYRVQQQSEDDLLRNEWLVFLTEARSEREQVLAAGQGLEAHDITIPDATQTVQVARLREAKERLAERGKLGWFSNDVKRALELCSVDGRVPTTAADVELCLLAVRRAELRRSLTTRWANRMSRVDGPQVDSPVPEDLIGGHLDDLDHQLGFQARWAEIVRQLGPLGIAQPSQPGPDELARLAEVLRIATVRPAERAATRQLEDLRQYLIAGSSRDDASPLWLLLADALRAQQLRSWDRLRSDVADLAAIAPRALRLRNLRRDLHRVAPLWTSRIVSNPAVAGEPGNLDAAWQWRQLETSLEALDRGDDPAQLQRRLEELSVTRRRTVAELVTERAWRRLADNLGDPQRQALNSYLTAVRRYGKTGGKFAARWLALIRRALDESKEAVPVWIMPTSRALTSFRPDRTPPFDVLVIDEASQIGLEALVLLSLARKTIVVGDDKQTSPENVGLDQQSVFNLLDEYLSAVPKYQTLFDAGNNSLYDVAFQKFPDVVMLTEHFRSLPPIIQFSNTHFYDGRIVPLRDQPPAPGWRSLGAIKVMDGYRVGDINEPEADAVVDLIEQLCADPSYDGMEFGVVSLLGSSQSKLIWDKLYETVGPEVLAQRRLRCGEPANFQGDERDVMIISTVVATDPNNPAGRIGAMTGRPAERRINVGASRARDQMWIVHSVDAERFPTGDLRAELIRHCQNPARITNEVDHLEAACESDFERRVVGRILARGYRAVKVQYQVGRYRIDIVVEGPDSRLAVECDGDRWHGDDVWYQDRARQQVLERAGWTFERIRGSAYYRDPDRALEPLWSRLDELGIPTGDAWLSSTPMSTVRTVIQREEPVAELGVPDEAVEQEEHRSEILAEATTNAPDPQRLRDSYPIETVEHHPGTREPDPLEPLTPELHWQAPRLGEVATPTDNPRPPAEQSRPRVSNGLMLAPYMSWPSHPLAEVDFASPDEIVAGLMEIVAVEGPMHALRAYQLYVKAAGGQRVGKEIRRSLNQATSRGLHNRQLAQINDSIVGQIDKTLYLPGQPPVVVRELGPRQLTEVPRSEIQALVERLGDAGPRQEVRRAILNALGLTRLTERVAEYLDDCLAYWWEA
jgi:very-short-patch-repair endonuclease